jgi:hypothetical protein
VGEEALVGGVETEIVDDVDTRSVQRKRGRSSHVEGEGTGGRLTAADAADGGFDLGEFVGSELIVTWPDARADERLEPAGSDRSQRVDTVINHACDKTSPPGVYHPDRVFTDHDDRDAISGLHTQHRSQQPGDGGITVGATVLAG